MKRKTEQEIARVLQTALFSEPAVLIAAERLIGKQPVPKKLALAAIAMVEARNPGSDMHWQDVIKAGELAEAGEFYDLAVEIYDRHKLYARAGGVCDKIGDLEKALRFYEKGENHGDAAKMCLRLGYKERAMNHYRNANEYHEARVLAHELNRQDVLETMFEEEIKYFKITDNRDLAKLAMEYGLKMRAMDYYERDGDFDASLELAEKMGNTKKAEALRQLLKLIRGN